MARTVTSTTLAPERVWRLERHDHQGPSVVAFAARPGLTCYAETAPATAPAHRCPAWKLVAPLGAAPVVVDDVPRAEPVLVAPMTPNAARCEGPFVALFLDVWCWPADLGDLDAPLRRELTDWSRSLLAGTAVVSDVEHLLRRAWGPGLPLGRTGAAVEVLRRTDDLDEPARMLGLSPSRTRALVRNDLGCTLTDIRRWLRLVDAYAALGEGSAAHAAADAGFADQSHLVRTSASYVGRTPGSVSGRSARAVPAAPRATTSAPLEPEFETIMAVPATQTAPPNLSPDRSGPSD